MIFFFENWLGNWWQHYFLIFWFFHIKFFAKFIGQRRVVLNVNLNDHFAAKKVKFRRKKSLIIGIKYSRKTMLTFTTKKSLKKRGSIPSNSNPPNFIVQHFILLCSPKNTERPKHIVLNGNKRSFSNQSKNYPPKCRKLHPHRRNYRAKKNHARYKLKARMSTSICWSFIRPFYCLWL